MTGEDDGVNGSGVTGYNNDKDGDGAMWQWRDGIQQQQ
jgi:hypothetical protein